MAVAQLGTLPQASGSFDAAAVAGVGFEGAGSEASHAAIALMSRSDRRVAISCIQSGSPRDACHSGMLPVAH